MPKRLPALKRLKDVRLLLMDVDGVLTDGRLYHFTDRGGRLVEFKGVDSHDGVSLMWLAQAGIKTGIISGRASEGVRARAKMVGMTHIELGKFEKLPVLEKISRVSGIATKRIAYIGDDLPDLPVLKRVGWSAAPANARPEVRGAVDYVTRARGGRGAVREIVEMLLKAQNRWKDILKRYSR